MFTFLKKTALVCTLVLLELLILWYFKHIVNYRLGSSSLLFNDILRQHGDYQIMLVSNIHRIFSIGLLSYFLMLIIILSKEIGKLEFFTKLNKYKFNFSLILKNIFYFFILLILFFIFNNPEYLIENPYSWQSLVFKLSPIIWILYLHNICNMIFPINIFIKIVSGNIILLYIVSIISLLFFSNDLMNFLANFWSSMLLIPTIKLASGFSYLFDLNYKLLPEFFGSFPAFGTSKFYVEITPACSGYEGMSLIVLLLGGYCFIQKKVLKLPKALLIIPIAGIMMFVLNGFRIFVLVAIGHYWSPQLAIDGFHSVAGWLNLLVTFILALLALNLPFFQKEAKPKRPIEFGDTALLIPLMTLIIVSLLTKAVNPNFAWFYPVNIVIATWTLYFFLKPFQLFLTRPSGLSVAIGVVVFLLWTILIPENLTQSAHFIAELNTAPLWLSLLWLLFRVLGAAVVIPIAEEFAFRGYLQPHLQNWFGRKGFKSASVIASLGITALLFGYVHSNMLAGSVAGLFFGLAYLQRRQLIDAVMAHAVTNALLAAYVMGFGYWSYW